MLGSFFHAILYKPIFNIFVFLYNVLPGHDVGLVILVITVIVRLVLYPLTNSAIRAQKSLQELQPKMNEIKKKYAGDKQKQAQATMELYKESKVSPFASCLPMLIQFPILIALYLVLRDGLASTNLAQNLYPFVNNPQKINEISFGLFNLAQPSFILAVLAGLAQFWQAKDMARKQPPKEAGAGAKDENMMTMMNKQMLYLMPFFTVLIGMKLAAGLTLYWFLSTLLMTFQQIFFMKKIDTNKNSVTPPKAIEGEIVK